MGGEEIEVRQLTIDDERILGIHAVVHQAPCHLAQQVTFARTPLSYKDFNKTVARVSSYFIGVLASFISEIERVRISQIVSSECLQSFVHNRKSSRKSKIFRL